MTYYLVLVYLIILGIDLAFITKRRFSSTASFANFTIVFFLYIFGLFLDMKSGMTAFLGAVTILTVWIIIKPKQGNKISAQQTLLDTIMDPAIFVYLVVGIMLGIILRVYLPNYDSDEFSHWALVTKNMYYYGNFGNIGSSTTMFNRYEPATGIFMYAFQIFNPRFIDGYLYAAFDLMMASLVLPVMGLFKNKKSLLSILMFIICFALPLIIKVNVYSNVGVDAMLGALGAYIFLIYMVDKGKVDCWTFVVIGFATFIVTLVKSSGIVFAIFGIVLIVLYVLTVGKKDMKSFFKNGANVLLLIVPIIMIVFAKLSWSWYNDFYQTRTGWNISEMTLPNIIKWMSSPNDYQSAITDLWLNKYFISSPIYTGNSYLGLPAILKYIIVIILSVVLGIKFKSKSFAMASSITIIFLSIGYAFFLLLMYLFSFSYSEGYLLNCYDRYTGSLTLIILLVYAYLYIEAFLIPVSNKHEESFNINFKGKIIIVKLSYKLIGITFSIIAGIGLIAGVIPSYIYSKNVRATDSYYMEIASKVPNDGTLYVVFIEPYYYPQGGVGIDYLKMRYYMTPRQCSGYQEGGTYPEGRESAGSYSGNIFDMEMDIEDFSNDVLNYDYLYLASVTDEFKNKFGLFFASEIKADTLYKITKNETNNVLIYI